MEQIQALDFIAKNKINTEKHHTVIVTSDSAVYLDSEIEAIEAHCKAHGKTYFIVKQKEVSVAVEEIEEPKKSKKK